MSPLTHSPVLLNSKHLNFRIRRCLRENFGEVVEFVEIAAETAAETAAARSESGLDVG